MRYFLMLSKSEAKVPIEFWTVSVTSWTACNFSFRLLFSSCQIEIMSRFRKFLTEEELPCFYRRRRRRRRRGRSCHFRTL